MSSSNAADSQDWIHELARNEINPDANSLFGAAAKLDPKQIIEESTIEFLTQLRDLASAYAKAFNSYSNGNETFSDIKIYGISNTAADFMLFRNNVKLIFAQSAQGIINISFTQHVRGELAVDGVSTSSQVHQRQSQDIMAQLGPFLDVHWTYQGEKVNPTRLAKYYFIEFAKLSRAEKKGSSNQLLLKQIKALLQDQGINL